MPRSMRGSKATKLLGAHRKEVDKTGAGGQFYIYWTAWRGKGAPRIGTYSGASRKDAEAAELADAEQLPGRYSEARKAPAISTKTLSGLLDWAVNTGEFTKCSASTQKERRRVALRMQSDEVVIEKDGEEVRRPLGTFPTAALASDSAPGIFAQWRDDQATLRGPRAAATRLEVLSRALNVAVKRNKARANPVADLEAPPDAIADRSALIWEEEHIRKHRALVRKKIAEVWATYAPDHPQRPAMIAALAAARDALTTALNTGKRRADIAATSPREFGAHSISYTARKGARRARTAGLKTSSASTAIPTRSRSTSCDGCRNEIAPDCTTACTTAAGRWR